MLSGLSPIMHRLIQRQTDDQNNTYVANNNTSMQLSQRTNMGYCHQLAHLVLRNTACLIKFQLDNISVYNL